MAAETKRVYLPRKQQVRRVNCAYRNCVIQAQRRAAMKHDSPHPCGEFLASGGKTTEIETKPIEIRDNASETTPVFWWGWPDEAVLAAFAEEDDQVEEPDGPLEDSSEYAILYFVS